MPVCNPGHVVGKVAIRHSADLHVNLLLDEGKVSRVAPGRRVVNSQSLFGGCDFFLLDQACRAIRVSDHHLPGNHVGVRLLAIHAFVVE